MAEWFTLVSDNLLCGENMNGYLHRRITYEACREAGFDHHDSEKVAEHSVSFDSLKFLKPFAHFRRFGSQCVSRFLFNLAVLSGSLRILGYSMHSIQDSISHGDIYPWEHRLFLYLDRVEDEETYRKVFEATLNLAREYLARRKDC